jgi:hypothetical protein
MAGQGFDEVHRRLRALLESYAPPLFVTADGPKGYGLDMAPVGEREPSTWFAGTRLGARYVSYYLMPVYMFPDLLADLSPRLRKRMQGKSCFNFTTVEDDLLAELAQLTQRGAERFRQESLL